MKAFVISGPETCYFTDVEMPQIKNPTDVLVKVKSVGICGTDLTIYAGRHPMAYGVDRIPGHEFSGEVIEVGSAVKDLKPGDRVVHEPTTSCGKCYACTHGQPNVCSSIQITGCNLNGGWQEYFCAPERSWHKIPDWITWTEAALIEPYTNAAQICTRADIQESDVVLIHGGGPLGLMTGDTAKHLGATVIISELMPGRLALAKEIGMDYALDPRETDLKEFVKELTGGEGVNVIVDCAGVGAMMDDNLEMLSPAGRFVTSAPAAFSLSLLSAFYIMAKQLKLIGSRLQYRKFKPVIAQFAMYKDNVDKMVTHTFRFEESDKAFQYNAERHPETGKVVVLFD